MPNALAFLMLIIWPLACVVMFRKLPFERAIIWSILGGYLILPPRANFDLPLVPSMDKVSIPSLCAALCCVYLIKRKFRLLPVSPVGKILTVLFVLGVIPTVLTNGDPMLFRALENTWPISFTTGYLPGLSLRDLFSVIANQLIVLLPFLLARQFLSTETGLREVLLALVVGGLAYSIPSLIEIRLSPQINIWVYGFFQHSFEQMMREGGFRPIVFLPHGLWLAFFLMTAVLAAAALSRTVEGPQRMRLLIATGYLMVVLYLCKSLASQLYALAFLPLVLFGSAKAMIRVAVVCALIAVVYPTLRNTGKVPLDKILEQAEAIDPARKQSLEFRFHNEEILLDRADEKPWFGWGGWGRNLLRDPQTGQIISIPDGRWIIVFGSFGWVGYIAEMGLLALPLFLLGLQARGRRSRDLSPYVAPIAIILAVTMIDMLLNATLIPYTWICAGAVLGYAERLRFPQAWEAGSRGLGRGPVVGGRSVPRRRRTIL